MSLFYHEWDYHKLQSKVMEGIKPNFIKHGCGYFTFLVFQQKIKQIRELFLIFFELFLYFLWLPQLLVLFFEVLSSLNHILLFFKARQIQLFNELRLLFLFFLFLLLLHLFLLSHFLLFLEYLLFLLLKILGNFLLIRLQTLFAHILLFYFLVLYFLSPLAHYFLHLLKPG